MAKVKTAELIGAALDWAVAECKKVRTYVRPYEHTMTGLCILDADLVDMETDDAQELRYSRDWAQGGPILEREQISVDFDADPECGGPCAASTRDSHCYWVGPTPLVAAMRCYVASKLGDEVEVPEEFL